MCRKVNYDYGISYEQLDAWAHMPEFQPLISKAMARQMSLDRIMIGFNGVKYSDPSDRAANPLLQDCGIGWLEKIRKEAPHRVISNVTITSRDEDNKIVAKGTYGNLGAAVYDAKNSLMDEWHKHNPDNVVILAGDLLTTSNFSAINALSQTNPNTEMLAGQLIVAQERVGNMPTFIAPYFPCNWRTDHAVQNLSVYYQRGGLRRTIKEEPEYNRVATYQSSNDDFVIEDYGNVAFIDGTSSPRPNRLASDRRGGGIPPPLRGEVTMLTPAQRHFQRVMAERRGQADEESDTQRTAHEQILHRLRMDLSGLSGVQSGRNQSRNEKSMLPEYEGWIEGTLDGDSGRQDEVITRLMVWAIDCRDYVLVMKLGRYVCATG